MSRTAALPQRRTGQRCRQPPELRHQEKDDQNGQNDAKPAQQRQHAKDHGDVYRHGDIGEQAEDSVGRQHEDEEHGGEIEARGGLAGVSRRLFGER